MCSQSRRHGRRGQTLQLRRQVLSWSRRSALVAVASLASAILLVAGGVVVGRQLTAGSSPTRGTQPLEKSPAGAHVHPPVVDSPREDSNQFANELAQMVTVIDAEIGVVVTSIGSAERPVVIGDWQSGPAWSTIKVPLAIASLGEQKDPSEVTDSIVAAITRSDNAAAEAVWQGLGDPRIAAQKVEKLLREAGDPTMVEWQKVRPQFSAFGQTRWSLADQSRFLSWAVCDNRSAPVLSLMSEVQDDQRWGLGVIHGAQFKGGWGPALDGKYLVRQIGVVPTSRGLTAVAMAVVPSSGTFEDGTEALTHIAGWISEHSAGLPAGRCP